MRKIQAYTAIFFGSIFSHVAFFGFPSLAHGQVCSVTEVKDASGIVTSATANAGTQNYGAGDSYFQFLTSDCNFCVTSGDGLVSKSRTVTPNDRLTYGGACTTRQQSGVCCAITVGDSGPSGKMTRKTWNKSGECHPGAATSDPYARCTTTYELPTSSDDLAVRLRWVWVPGLTDPYTSTFADLPLSVSWYRKEPPNEMFVAIQTDRPVNYINENLSGVRIQVDWDTSEKIAFYYESSCTTSPVYENWSLPDGHVRKKRAFISLHSAIGTKLGSFYKIENGPCKFLALADIANHKIDARHYKSPAEILNLPKPSFFLSYNPYLGNLTFTAGWMGAGNIFTVNWETDTTSSPPNQRPAINMFEGKVYRFYSSTIAPLPPSDENPRPMMGSGPGDCRRSFENPTVGTHHMNLVLVTGFGITCIPARSFDGKQIKVEITGAGSTTSQPFGGRMFISEESPPSGIFSVANGYSAFLVNFTGLKFTRNDGVVFMP